MMKQVAKGIASCVFASWLVAVTALAQGTVHGPYNGEFPSGGDGLTKRLPASGPLSSPSWSMYGWVQIQELPTERALIAGVGDFTQRNARYFALESGSLLLLSGGDHKPVRTTSPPVAEWHFIAATSDGGTARLFVDGAEVAQGTTGQSTPEPVFMLAPRQPRSPNAARFTGRIAGFSVAGRALTASEIKTLSASKPDPLLVNFESGSPTWPVQVRQMYGQVAPQDAWTLPRSKASFTKPVAKPVPERPALQAAGKEKWRVAGWRLAAAPEITASGAQLSQAGFDATSWYVATVPGTVLTTLIDRGVYPDPDFGINNLAIPESLHKQDYWYRTAFEAPAQLDGRRVFLLFKGANYAADVWLNGEQVGRMQGAFIRGQFDVTGKLNPGTRNVLAVRVSPPPHPGIAHEESLTAGVGENGGMLALDGPTFVASEGWDWIPTVRDRNTGLWQDVELIATGTVRIGDPHVVTSLPLPDISRAGIEITVPLDNLTSVPVQAELRAAFADVAVSKTVTLNPGSTAVKLTPGELDQLTVRNPRLWWPNGYGEPSLYTLQLTVTTAGSESDRSTLRFGIRHVTYELSLMDSTGHLRRVAVDLTKARARGERIVDVRHEAIRKVPDGWAASLRAGAELSPAVHELQDTRLTPHLVIKVNGVRIAAKGGNWGTDDWRKRVSREKLEPYFRLHRDAHLNVIRNWVGQNTEEVFYELADEYALMVLNDFWASTQDYQLQPQDVPLFLKNAEDVIRRFRNHPSIVLWFGRNEGVPQPILNEGLDALIAEADGTRFYTGSSNRVNLAGSGPYNYREPATYFTEHAQGFSVEVGTPSFPTLESFKRSIPESDLWPISDAWAYHDWHQSGNGDTKTFMDAMQTQLGAATSLEDFERKAQMMNYVTHRAMFEGMNAHLWTKNSGRLLWMTQPAWPSTMWQILSSDYDTHGSFYGVKKASEPVHVQMNLPDHSVVVVNNTAAPLSAVTVHAQVLSLDNRLRLEERATVEAPAVAVSQAFVLNLAPALEKGVALIKLEALDSAGRLLSENFYWLGKDAAALRQLNELPRARVEIFTQAVRAGDEARLRVRLRNTGTVAALANKVTLMNTDGSQVLPAYLSDNYISLLPGESREIEISHPVAAARGRTRVTLRGWNTQPAFSNVTVRK